jgi:hypothetical protein
VTQGTGIGLPHSGDLTDWVFYCMVEAQVLPLLQAFGIAKYWRYRDDILLLSHSKERAYEFVAMMRRLSACYKLEVKDVSSIGLRHLNLYISFDEDGRLHARPGYKPTALGLRLAPSSAHHESVHSSWPLMMLRHVKRLCSHADEVHAEQESLARRFLNDGMPAYVVASAWQKLHEVRKSGRRPATSSCTRQDVWMPLPYHPIWGKSVAKYLSRFNRDLEFTTLWANRGLVAPRVRLAWSNFMPANQCTFQALPKLKTSF